MNAFRTFCAQDVKLACSLSLGQAWLPTLSYDCSNSWATFSAVWGMATLQCTLLISSQILVAKGHHIHHTNRRYISFILRLPIPASRHSAPSSIRLRFFAFDAAGTTL